ncbi:MAG: SpoIIE family protein phosphatase [Bacteroidetes bacterium]|nr:SpoIIE family protein phosphatase [Bacteroidota bacterium]
MLFLRPILLDQMKNANFFSDAISWFFLFLNVCLIVGGYILYKQLTKKFAEENKKISDKLSDRSYNVMMQKWDLERKNLSISQQNQEILDSLHYAKNIQSAIMPHADSIDRIFKDGFVLYMPKDIVSGDFYFLEELNDRIYLAVADCTGHGVAGAFMSMVGTALLKQIILQNKFTDPAKILNDLNEGIVEALRQKQTSSHGGMDIAMCVIDKMEMTLKFAGANRPLHIVRNFTTELIKPDKLPIGGFNDDENRTFKSQQIALEKGDHIYLYSDGYADQFGGMEGKKIMTKKFRELIENMHQTPMKSQHDALLNYFNNWKGKFEQVDDVLVIGVVVE